MPFAVSGPGSAVLILAALLLMAAFLWWQDFGIRKTEYDISLKGLPWEFDGFRITQISDYHNCTVLEKKVLRIASECAPDIILVTGDLIDSRHTDIEGGLSLSDKLPAIAPTYFVPGNHEARLDRKESIFHELRNQGLTVLLDEKVNLRRGGSEIALIGLQDPRFYGLQETERTEGKDSRSGQIYRAQIDLLIKSEPLFRLVAAHRPEFLPEYAAAGADMIFSGHSHGGQFSIPFTDIGVFVPNQGLFPKYAAGRKTCGDAEEIISRGIGNSAFPFRLFNRPEVILATLHTKEN